MIVVADTSVVLDFLDGVIDDPFKLIKPYKIILMSPVTLHEVLRTYPNEVQLKLIDELEEELLPVPGLNLWIEAAAVLQDLYPLKTEKGIARMQNDILIALSARGIGAPVWSRDADFGLICNHLGVGIITE